MKATGENIKRLIKEEGYTTTEIQDILLFTTPQAIYKWYRGETLPTLDNLVILAYLLNTTIDEILIINL